MKSIIILLLIAVIVNATNYTAKPHGLTKLSAYHKLCLANISVHAAMPVTIMFEGKKQGLWNIPNIVRLELVNYRVEEGSTLYVKNDLDDPVDVKYKCRSRPILGDISAAIGPALVIVLLFLFVFIATI